MKTIPRYFYLSFIKKEKISKDVFAFYFGKKNINLDFLAGQYVHIYLPVANEKGRGNSRMFTVASSPLEKDYIVVVTKKGNSIFKKSLFKLTPQIPVKFFGPSGSLVIDEIKKPSYVFLSLGIGITPFRSIIKYISQKNLSISITLLASFSKKENFLFFSELMDISKSNQNIKIIYTLARITDALIKKNIKNINGCIYYITGSPKNVFFLEDVVCKMGVSDDRIFIENFEGY